MVCYTDRVREALPLSYGMIIIAAAMFGLYNVFVKMSSDHIQPVLGAVVLQFVAAFLGLGLLLYLHMKGTGPFKVTTRGLGLAVLAGVSIGIVEVLTFFIYGLGVPVAVGNPLIIGGSLVVTTTVGIVALREATDPFQIAGIVLIGVGVAFLAWGAARSVV